MIDARVEGLIQVMRIRKNEGRWTMIWRTREDYANALIRCGSVLVYAVSHTLSSQATCGSHHTKALVQIVTVPYEERSKTVMMENGQGMGTKCPLGRDGRF
jgi:riboflavin synthase alpha subunit